MLRLNYFPYNFYNMNNFKRLETELENSYREISQDKERQKLTKEWEKMALKDLNKRIKN